MSEEPRSDSGLVDQSEVLEASAQARWARFEGGGLRRVFVRAAGALRLGELARQRVKMFLLFSWGYWPLLLLRSLSLTERVGFLVRFLRVDWSVLHGHLPTETAAIAAALAQRPARDGEVMIEAGCWRGGSSVKFSLLCERFGYHLHIFDSFEGVEVLNPDDQAKEWHFGGQYASPVEVLHENLKEYGRPEIVSVHKGWYSETLALQPFPHPVRVAYIDCDLGKGTMEVLRGVMPSLARDGCVFTQDFHIPAVRRVLLDPQTWQTLGWPVPRIRSRSVYLAELDWPSPRPTQEGALEVVM